MIGHMPDEKKIVFSSKKEKKMIVYFEKTQAPTQETILPIKIWCSICVANMVLRDYVFTHQTFRVETLESP